MGKRRRPAPLQEGQVEREEGGEEGGLPLVKVEGSDGDELEEEEGEEEEEEMRLASLARPRKRRLRRDALMGVQLVELDERTQWEAWVRCGTIRKRTVFRASFPTRQVM